MEGTELEATPCSSLVCRYVRGCTTHLRWVYPYLLPFRGCWYDWLGRLKELFGVSCYQAWGLQICMLPSGKVILRNDWLMLGSGRTGNQSLGLNGPCSSKTGGTL
jgi:hypothetical protein